MTKQEVLTVGASYWLNQRTDGKGVNIAGIMRDTALGRDVVKAAIAELESNHKDWLAEYGELVMAEAKKELVSEEFTRIRAKINRFAGRLIDKTEETFFKLHDACQSAALKGRVKEDSDEFQSLKIKQFERRASLGILRQAVSMAQELESAIKPLQAGPIGQQIISFEKGDSEKIKENLERLGSRTAKLNFPANGR